MARIKLALDDTLVWLENGRASRRALELARRG